MDLMPFNTNLGHEAFTKIPRDRFAEQLRDRLIGKFTIKQGGSSLCGPAAALYCWLKKKPDDFALYASQLYEWGQSNMGSIRVKPGVGCKTFKPAKEDKLDGHISYLDWVVLASLRDSQNSVLPYDNEGRAMAGVTPAWTMAKWFHSMGFRVATHANFSLSGDLQLLFDAFLFNRCWMVCLLIDYKVIRNQANSFGYPNHWVVITSDMKIDGKPLYHLPNRNAQKELFEKSLEFNVFSWGDEKYSINWNREEKPMVVKEFLGHYFGFVAVL